VLLIVASASDSEARQLASSWEADDAHVLTCADLSQPGWRWSSCDTSADTFAVSGQRIASDRITGVLTRMDTVAVDDLVHVHPDDRPYVASEMHAFLVAWLSRLQCVVINRPTPRCLLGPRWPPEAWLALAVRLGIPISSVRRRIQPDSPPELSAADAPQQAVVVGNRVFGSSHAHLREQALRLARAAATDLLAVAYDDEGRLVSADPRPALDAQAVIDAVRFDLLSTC
jgi:hypothetical protein